MSAHKFFKEYGPDESLDRVTACELSFSKSFNADNGEKINADELRRILWSHEIVLSKGGFDKAKVELQRQSILRWVNPKTERLRKAVEDVEACQ